MIDTELYHNKWISLREIIDGDNGIKGYVYSRETRCNSMIVSILPYRKAKGGEPRKVTMQYQPNGSLLEFHYEYLLKSEVTPCWNVRSGDMKHQTISTITGGVENGNALKSAIMELKEETGYKVTQKDLIFLRMCYASKSSDTIYFLYSVDLTGKKQGKATGDGSALEAQSTAKWLLEKDILDCYDPLASVDLLRLKDYLEHPRLKVTYM